MCEWQSANIRYENIKIHIVYFMNWSYKKYTMCNKWGLSYDGL